MASLRVSAMDPPEPIHAFHVLPAVLEHRPFGECDDVGDSDIDADGLELIPLQMDLSAMIARIHQEYDGDVVFVVGSHVRAGHGACLGRAFGDIGSVQTESFPLRSFSSCDLPEADVVSSIHLADREPCIRRVPVGSAASGLPVYRPSMVSGHRASITTARAFSRHPLYDISTLLAVSFMLFWYMSWKEGHLFQIRVPNLTRSFRDGSLPYPSRCGLQQVIIRLWT